MSLLTVFHITANLFFMTRPYKSETVSTSKPTGAKAKYLSTIFCLLLSAFSGCTAPPEEEPIWKDLKIGDLAPRREGKPEKSRLVESTNFNLFVFEMHTPTRLQASLYLRENLSFVRPKTN